MTCEKKVVIGGLLVVLSFFVHRPGESLEAAIANASSVPVTTADRAKMDNEVCVRYSVSNCVFMWLQYGEKQKSGPVDNGPKTGQNH